MSKKRKETEKFILKYIQKIDPSGINKKLYEDVLFKNMSNKEFDEFMENIKTNKTFLTLTYPNSGPVKLDVERNLKIAKELGYDFFQHIIVKNSPTGIPDYKTPNKYMVYKLPVKRTVQLLSKKISIPTDNKSINLLSGQVTGKSKSSKLTFPELQILAGLGLKSSIVELMKYRGGDIDGNRALNTMLYKQGMASQEVLKNYATGVVSTKTLRAYLLASHLNNTL